MIKDELRHIIPGEEQIGVTNKLKTVQDFLGRDAKIGHGSKEQRRVQNRY